MTAALLALDAKVHVAGGAGRRLLNLEALLDEGLQPGELVEGLVVPKTTGRTTYLKLRRRRANSPAVVAVAAHVDVDAAQRCRNVRLALIGAGTRVVRSVAAERELEGNEVNLDRVDRAASAAMETAAPFTDALASEWYRRRMVGVFVRRALVQALGLHREAEGAA
jgi:CO/xanthine dehydrogenase FAD-binding subunit